MQQITGTPRWGSFWLALGLYIVITATAAYLLYWWISGEIGHAAPIETTILVAKAVSLIALVIVGGTEITRAERCPKPLLTASGVITFYAGVIALLIVVRIVLMEVVHSQEPPFWFPFSRTYHFMSSNGDYLAVSPLFLFAFLNLLTWALAKEAPLQQEALAYVCVSDVPCLLPIIAVFLLVAGVGNYGDESHIFVSGAMAMFVLTSNLLTLSVRHIVHPALNLDPPCNGP